jgi:hypothetical protein
MFSHISPKKKPLTAWKSINVRGKLTHHSPKKRKDVSILYVLDGLAIKQTTPSSSSDFGVENDNTHYPNEGVW